MKSSSANNIHGDGTRRKRASKLKVYATPTLLLIDAHGQELVPRIVGIDSVGFFSAYLDQSIEAARAKLLFQ